MDELYGFSKKCPSTEAGGSRLVPAVGGWSRETEMYVEYYHRKYTKTFTEIQIQKEIHKIVHWNALTGIQIFH